MLEHAGTNVIAGVGTPLEAVVAAAAGASLIYVSGYASAAWSHAVADVGLSGLSDIVESAARVTRKVGVPVIVDADTGYGDAAQVRETVRRLEDVGVAGVQIEDQVWPKRCGHMSGKLVEPVETMQRKVEAAVAARRNETIVIARSDAREVEGIDGAILRVQRYLECGADVVFVDAPESVDELSRIGSEVAGPLLVNMSESGKTPILSVAELGALGFTFVLFPTSALRLAVASMREVYRAIVVDGDTRPLVSRMASLDEVNKLVGLDELVAFEQSLEKQV